VCKQSETKKDIKTCSFKYWNCFVQYYTFRRGGHTAERSWRLTYRRWRCCNISEHIIFLYGNYTLLSQNDTQININEIDDYRDCIIALNQSYGKKAFDESITTIKEQVERFKKKKEKIFEILGQKFDVIDKVYEKFKTTIFDVEYVFLSNIKAILSKINAFDEEDYERLCRDISQKKFSDEVIASKKNIYKSTSSL